MNCQTRPRLLTALVLTTVVLATAPTGHALLIDFNSYTAGSQLQGQPASGTQWSGGGTDFLVTAGAGMSGSNAVVTQSKASGTTNSLFSPGETDLPGFNGASSILDVSFKFRFVNTPDANTNTVAAIQFGYDGADVNVAARFYLRSDGRLGYNQGESSTILVPNTTFQISDTTTWTTISASLNFATQQYSFSINGTPYVTGGGNAVFDFRGATDAAGIRLADSGSANWKGVAFDDISASVAIPEPTSAALITASVLAGLSFVRRRREVRLS